MQTIAKRRYGCEHFAHKRFGPKICADCLREYRASYYRGRQEETKKVVGLMTEEKARQLLRSAISNLTAALESISSKCTDECPSGCQEIAHADSEPDCESAADEILEAERRIKEYLNIVEQLKK